MYLTRRNVFGPDGMPVIIIVLVLVLVIVLVLVLVIVIVLVIDSEDFVWSGWNALRGALEAGGP